jgi:hypothetical protein
VDCVTKRKKVLSLILLAVIGLASGAGYLGFRYLETKSMACECDDPVDGARFALWNPLRDRGAERAGEAVLRAMQSGACKGWPNAADLCAPEGRFKILGWNLTGRTQQSGSVTLRYWVLRKERDQSDFGDPVWVTVTREGGAWKPANVDLYY